MSTSVKTPFSEQNRPTDYIVKNELFHHPLVNRTMFKHRKGEGKLNEKTENTLYWLLVKSRDHRDMLKFSLSNSYLEETVGCGYRSVSRYLKRLEDNGYIIRSPVLSSNGKKFSKTNYFEICWLKLYEDFGEHLFVDFMENMVTFIKGRIAQLKAVFKSLNRPLWQMNKLISSKEDIYNNIYDNLIKNGVISMEQEVMLKGEYEKTPLDELLEENEAENRSYFNRDVRLCPCKWREIALKLGMAPEYIEDEFIEFRDFWISQGKIKFAKRASWTRTWQRRIRDILNNYRTSYKRASTPKMPLIENHNSYTSLPAERMHWNKEIANEGFWKIPGNPDNSKFTEFYTTLEKGGNIMDTKAGWLQRGLKWFERTRTEQSPSVKAYGECKMLEIKIPDELSDIHKRLAKRLEEQNYIAWVQTPNVGISLHPSPTDRYTYLADYTSNCGAFTKKTVLERYRTDFDDLKIEII